MIFMTLWIYNVVIWTLIEEFPAKVAAFDKTYVMSHVSIWIFLTCVTQVLRVRNQKFGRKKSKVSSMKHISTHTYYITHN
jgi:hypothetical protein